VMVLSALDGILCNSRPEPDPAMECCRKDASRLDASMMEDCCQPARGENAPAEELVTGRSKTELDHVANVATLPSRLLFSDETHRTLFSRPRGLPDLIPHPPRAVPLLI
jgi:hypothetical protein